MGETFQSLEDARNRLLKEEADYRDALSAYFRAIGTPQQIEAGRTLDREEAEYRAIDEAVATYTQQNCSISNYTADKVYEYYAALEMVYKLATDAAFRQRVVQKIEELFQGGFLGNYMAANKILDHVDTLYRNKPDGLSYGLEYLFGDDESYAKLEQYDANVQREIDRLEHMAGGYRDEAFRALGAYFASVWQQIKAKYHDCGLLYAVTVTGIDGAFLAAEIGVGVSFLRGLKFVRRILPDGKLHVDVADIEGRTLASASWSREALEAKYGTPQQNHVGGFEPDTNRQIPDKPAEDVLREKQEGYSSAYRHPREGQPLRLNEELAPGGRVPFDRNDPSVFQRWWDDLSPAELEQISQNRALRDKIRQGIRNGGGEHEWLKVSQQFEHKRLGFSMREIQEWVTATRAAEGPLPQPNAQGLTRWRHSSESGRGSGPGSVTMHNALDELYGPPPARDRSELLRRMGYFANHYLDHGVDSLPPGLKSAILQAGGG